MDCGACPWGVYTRRGITAQEFEQYKENAKKILGFKPFQKPCFSCQTPDDKIPKESKLPLRNCLVRKCVTKAGIENCAYCSLFPCETEKSIATLWNRQKFEEKLGKPISEKDYHAFIEPFEALKRLQTIRAKLKPEEIVEPPKVAVLKLKVVDFPKDLPFSKEETAAYKAVHQLLSEINKSQLGLTDTDTFAQQKRLEQRRTYLLRFMWIFGCFGEFREEKGSHLIVDATTFLANRGNETILAVWLFVKDTVFKALLEFGVQCDRVALKGVDEKDLTTGTGYMRSRGWIMKIAFKEKIGGPSTLKALQTYAKKLEKKFGKKAFQHFSNVDMQVIVRN
jgi:hypothetical protein